MTDTGPNLPSRAEMERALAERFGYPDYQSFRQGVVRTIGRGGLKRLEKELERYGPPAPEGPPAGPG